ncbi:GDYXXLXY domain-containing protein [Desulfosporosinus nitroreducens]|uniref:GDYXXLXY domain-containing protein n=1 Tax=Desulfosporosinus nitroreducens TaxID=2018668 RepID=A0ABT8QUN7_9FIRM|nr:GDYXXLXY domain-containing protein [Desulfosporosinus nitroreducens]MCO1602223.1 GDYXXLXY domain-containing protein [Desulfosporosinus nitroreducens]MDO0825066.1 GDYXXLXY domain-containing protein [Desulfosporosinus nitroreducens]
MTKKKSFFLAMAIPLLILLAMTIKPQATVLFGKEVVLETKAYDPTDLFRGDYVAINFAISDVPKSKVPLSIDEVYNKNLYVSLKQEGKYYVVDQVSETKPKQGLYLKGKFQNSFNETNTYRVDYSLDKYFVEQGSGKELEQESFQGGLVGTVKVLGGYGVLTGITPR